MEVHRSQHRDARVEVLRCVMMYLIVVHHIICHTSHAVDFVLFPVFLLTIPAVDTFLSISGLFGIQFSWQKCGVVAGQILFYGALSSAISILAFYFGWLQKPLIGVGVAWFGVVYLALMMVCPVLNKGLTAVSEDGRASHVAFVLVVLLFGDYLSRAIGLGFTVQGFGSYTFGTFFLVYCLMRLFVLSGVIRSRKFVGCGVIASIVYVCVFLSVRYWGHATNCIEVLGEFGLYNCPLVVIVAMASVSLVLRIRFPRVVENIATFIGPSMFAVYLIHDASPLGRMFVGYSVSFSALGALGWSMVVFAVSLLIDLLVRRLPLHLAKRALGFKCLH